MFIDYNAKTLTENKAVHCLQFTIKRYKKFPLYLIHCYNLWFKHYFIINAFKCS